MNTTKILLLAFLFISTSGLSLFYPTQPESEITCTDEGCYGSYIGPKFIDGSDVAHQFSNSMSAAVGDKLKELFGNKLYSIVDFDNIKMTTKGMSSGHVTYTLEIPF